MPIVLSSDWGDLNPDLIATIVPCDSDGSPKDSAIAVAAPLRDGTMEQRINWNSPFSNFSVEQSRTTLAGMLQSGSAEQYLDALQSLSESAGLGDKTAGKLGDAKDFLDKAAGRSGITKMNSRQVYSGHDQLNLSIVMMFRGRYNPRTEVVEPWWELYGLAVPKKLALNALANAAEQANSDASTSLLQILFPSEAPGFVSFTYKKETYAPMVIENISKPMTAPYSTLGDVYLDIPITLTSRESLDREDVKKIRRIL